MSIKTETSFKSTCSYCGVGCGVIVKKDRQNKITVEGDKDHPVNKGMLCSKGMNLHYTLMDKSDRLLYPEMRWNRSQPLQRVTWEEGLDRAAAVFKSIIAKHGPDSVGFYVSGQCLTEEYYLINKLIKGFIGSNNIDTNSRLCMSSAVVGYKMTLGEDSVPLSYDDIELSDCILVTGANPAWCHPILWRRVEAHKAANPDVKIIVVDPRKTNTCSIADIHLQVNPGTDVVLYNAIGRALIEMEYIDEDFIEKHTDGFIKYYEQVMKRSLREAASICGVKLEDIRWTAQYIGESKGFISMWAMGLNQSVIGTNKNVSLINLSLITGKIGKPGNGPFSLTGQPNAMGGREVGGLANLLPAHRNLLDPDHRVEVEKFWKIESGKIASKPGLTATEMFDAMAEGKLKAVWIVCTNPLVSLPDTRMVEEALKKARFVIVQDISKKSDTLKYADLVLPAAMWGEKQGTMTNSERRISYLNKVTEAPGEALPDAEIIIRFAKKMGFGDAFNFRSEGEIFEEHTRSTAGTNIDITGLNYEILKEEGTKQWPYSSASLNLNGGTKRLFTDFKFYTPNQRAQIIACEDENHSEKVLPDFPLILTTGRIRDQWHTMTRTGKVNKLKQHIGKNYLEIHPKDAAQREIKEGDLVEVLNPRGAVRVNAKVTTDIKRGVVFLPMHFGKILQSDLSRTNNLTNNLVDPKSKEPDFKFSVVQVKKYNKPRQKILIIGAGAAAFGFVKSYREINDEDEIEIFSNEIYPFYNRVMLPDYFSGEQHWEQLIKMQEGEENDYRIRLNRGKTISKINPQDKFIEDSEGIKYSYDLLIIGTGSRPNIPSGVPSSLSGIFTMRTRNHADELKNYTKAGDHVVVVGGGLLGLEMAASLKEVGIEVTLIQRSLKLMDRQLDALGSQLLYEEVADRGISVYFNDEIQTFLGHEKLTGLKMKSGRYIECNALIYAVGTVPNTELAKEAGLQCNRGVVVNEYLQTSHENIYAIGELAEFNQVLFGITAAAEHQAEVLSKYLGGDMSSYYEGSLSMNILKISGLNLCSIGTIETPRDPEYEEVIFIDKSKRYYKKCIIHKDRLVGAILIGDKTEFAEFKDLIQNKIELSEKRLQLLRSGQKGESVLGKLVCSCNNVGEGNIINRIQGGIKDLKELCQLTGAGMGCGSCKPEVKNILEGSWK
ncbi:MAG TPA: molybdopterin-dependent oxidoreductase [Cytophagales bacterium]|nr:molybdopterin-dependent oxidoreductase [Cytophagales bacterium]